MKKDLQTEFSTRQYMISRDFEIYYYHDEALPLPVSLHLHDYYEFYFFLSGNLKIQIENQLEPLRTGDMILIPPEVLHRPVIENMDVPYNRFVLWVSRDYFDHLETISSDYVYMLSRCGRNQGYILHNDQITFNAIQSRIFRLIEEQRSTQFGHVSQCDLCVRDLLLFLNRLVYNHHNTAAPAVQVSLHENVVDYIKNHLEEDLSLEQLSQKFFVSKFYISHIFKEFYGVSVGHYIIQKRLEVCRQAIESGAPITKVCRQFGFRDYSCFYRAFKKEYGISPKECQDMIFYSPKTK